MKRVYSVVSVYGNGNYVVNGVKIENLPDQIKEQLKKTGKTLFVDGVCIFHGFFRKDEVMKWEKKINDNKEEFWRNEDTSPYL